MINSNDGTVLLQGTLTDILSDFTIVIKRVHDMLTNECGMPEEEARKTIAKCGQMAFTPDNVLNDTIDKVEGVLKSGGGEEQLKEAIKDFAAWAGVEIAEISPEAFTEGLKSLEEVEDKE